MNRIKAVILANELEDDHLPWVKACNGHNDRVDYRVVRLTSSGWFEEIMSFSPRILLAKPGGLTPLFKQLYDERIFILAETAKFTIFPSPVEIYLYENKRLLSYWLEMNGIPHPSTWVLYDYLEAKRFITSSGFPVVAKTNIGASGSGVTILRSVNQAEAYLYRTFRGKGSPQRTGPNFEKGDMLSRGLHYVKHPGDIGKKLTVYRTRAESLQKGFVLFQEYIQHEFEWRVVRIGDSFFAHKKVKLKDKASGTLLKTYDNPPPGVLEFVRDITNRHKMYSQAVDLFESDRGYLVNELQCIFGQSDPFQMKVDGIAGRYRHSDSGWIFEEGDWARNQCYDLRLDYLLNTITA
jgi:hypothetical protein